MPTTITFFPLYGSSYGRFTFSGFHLVKSEYISKPYGSSSTSVKTLVSIWGILTGSCFWYMHAFMQSLHIRWPVPGHIGLSIIINPSAPIDLPSYLRKCISDIFSSRGQPLSGIPHGCRLGEPSFSLNPFEQESLFLSWQNTQYSTSFITCLSLYRSSVSLNPSLRLSDSSVPVILSGMEGVTSLL